MRSPSESLASFDAFFRRELSAGKSNRSFIVFPIALLAIGFAPLVFGNVSQTAQLYLLQALLYLIPLFALISGTSAAQADSQEDRLLLSLPVSQATRVTGKFAALLALQALAQITLYLPSLFAGAHPLSLLGLWGYGVGIAAVFLALGLLAGLRIDDGVRAHLLALGAWLAVTFGFGLLAWLLATTGWAQQSPGLWLAFLGASPLEALRVGVLFSIEAIPFSPDTITGAGRLWLDHPALWFSTVSTLWTLAALTLARPSQP